MTTPLWWCLGLVAPPLGVVVLARTRLHVERLRHAAVLAAAGALAVAVAAFLLAGPTPVRWAWPFPVPDVLGGACLRLDAFVAPLLLLPAALWGVTVGVTPRSRLDRDGLQRTAGSTIVLTLVFCTDSPGLLALLAAASTGLVVAGLGEPEHRHARRVAGAYLWAHVVLLTAGVALSAGAPDGAVGTLGMTLVVVAVLLRKGIVPFHAWIPEVFDQGRLGPAVLFSAPQAGTYMAAVLVLPRAGPLTLDTVALLALVTTVYGAALACVQRDPRRACGYLFVSQSALVLAGLVGRAPAAVGGALVLWLSSAVAFTALARAVLVLEARRGRCDLTRFHGGYEQMPLLAVAFLVLGLACTGFPGTLGFVGEELLITGAVHRFPVLGFGVVIASALTGLAVLRMYFALFCGAPSPSLRLALRHREALVFGAAAAVLVVAGLFPQPLVRSRLRAAQALVAPVERVRTAQ